MIWYLISDFIAQVLFAQYIVHHYELLKPLEDCSLR